VGCQQASWSEDDNSPLIISSAQSGTITLAGQYDTVLVKIVEGSSSLVGAFDLQINGDTGANYEYVTVGGTETTGASAIELAGDWGHSVGQVITMSGEWGAEWSCNTGVQRARSNRSLAGNNSSVTSPLDSITIKDDGSKSGSLTARVYGVTSQ